jgi:hypothetical protein
MKALKETSAIRFSGGAMKPGKPFSLAVLAAGFAGLFLLKDEAPVIRLAAASLGMIWVIKLAAFLWQVSEGARLRSPLGLLAYFTIWPGVSLAGFLERKKEPPIRTGERFLEAWLSFVLGALALLALCLWGKGQSLVLNYASLICVLLIVHLGLMEVIADLLRLLGFSPSSLFDRPFLATSLRDFWSARWNLAFVDMNRIFLLKPLHGKLPAGLLVFSIFAVSGLLHELGISYAAGAGWGLPLLYFVIQGTGMELEKRWKLPRFLVWLWVLLPVPLLFTPAFVDLFLGGLGALVSGFVLSFTITEALRAALVLGGFAHLMILGASFQVPGKLGWKEEFRKLKTLNRKVFWTYGAYILVIIIFMSGVSFTLARNVESLGSPPALLWLFFIALFWWARVLTDHFYMSHEDWPEGPLFTVGHACLSTLFLFLACLYTALLVSGLRH